MPFQILFEALSTQTSPTDLEVCMPMVASPSQDYSYGITASTPTTEEDCQKRTVGTGSIGYVNDESSGSLAPPPPRCQKYAAYVTLLLKPAKDRHRHRNTGETGR
jgi:hypothetical protein